MRYGQRISGVKIAMLLAVLALGARPQEKRKPQGGVRGNVTVAVEGVSLANAGPVVIYLDAVEGKPSYEVPKDVPIISQKDAQFSPAFLIIAAGQTVSMPNDDRIVHNVFSYSKAKSFDLGLYPKGESKAVTFEQAGIVDLFCSIHAKMNATIFIAPSPYFARCEASGSFQINGVPAGSYRLRAWSRRLPTTSRMVEIKEDVLEGQDLSFEAKK